ncbi:hypothetical protein [Lutibacter sp.]|nr:hypothetical protein [Lutibacter sp.]MBI9042075.1 hypothetical protein [Lutibacter sp.]
MRNELKVIKEKDRDLWYKRMGDRIPHRPEDEPVVGLIEWIELKLSIKI